MSDENQRQYELTLILSPNLKEEELVSLEQEVEKNIKELGGNLEKKSEPEKRSLTYPIKKFESGYFINITLSFIPEKIQELLSAFKHKTDILRYLISFAPEKPTSVISQRLFHSETKKEDKSKSTLVNRQVEKREKVKVEEIDQKLNEILDL